MARKKPDDHVKRTLLLCFVLVCVALIVGVYITNLSGGGEAAPGFQRGVPVGWVGEIGDWTVEIESDRLSPAQLQPTNLRLDT